VPLTSATHPLPPLVHHVAVVYAGDVLASACGRAATLLGVPVEGLVSVLLTRRLLVSGEWIHVPLTVEQACVSRDGLSKVCVCAVPTGLPREGA
jgi:hypothetical protein